MQVIMKQLFVFASFLILAAPRSIQFTKTLTCVQQDIFQCAKWNQSTVLSYSVNMPTGFSQNTYVLTSQGPKPISALKIEEEILALDPQRGKIYSKVIAWLHRDTECMSKCHKITTNEGPSFEISQNHNVAVFDQLGNMSFKFSKDLNRGDDLFESNPHVEQVTEQGLKKGLYSPFTQIGNYYILDTSVNEEVKGDSNYSMILIHALPQVRNPNSQLIVAQKLINFLGFFGFSKQPTDSEAYSHPILYFFALIIGENYVESTQELKYELIRNGQSSSYSLVQPSSSSSSDDQQQKQRDRIFSAGLSFDMIIGLTLL